jgi:pimeloyl-ACP methyl ester carboxylesterase
MRRALLALALVVGALALVLVAAGVTYTPNTDIPPGLGGTHILVEGIPIRVLQEGSGPDVLLIHGSPGSLEDWTPIRRALKRHARVTSFDRPNNGFSGYSGEASLEHNADIALAIIDAMKLEDVTVVGHSYGGSTALAMAVRSPARVKSYVVLDSALYTSSREATPILRVLAVPGLGTGFARLVGSKLAGPRIAAGLLESFRVRKPSQEFIDQRVSIWSTPKVTVSIAEETIGSPAFLAAQSPRYPEIRRPVRMVAQAEDAFRRETAERLHREVAGSTLRLLRGTGHFVQMEKPRKVLHEIRAAMQAG